MNADERMASMLQMRLTPTAVTEQLDKSRLIAVQLPDELAP